MWEKARELLERGEKVRRGFFEIRRARGCRPTWEPPVDIFAAEDGLWVLVALPGVQPEKVQVLVQERVLVIQGERSLPTRCRAAEVHRLEIPHGRFERHLDLPAGGFDIFAQELENGCLVIGLRRIP